jgi:hypothetical protein
MSAERWTVHVRGEAVPMTTFRASGAVRGTLLFLHGYARQPLDYRLMLEELARRGWTVHAPFLFANHRLRRPPTSFWAAAASRGGPARRLSTGASSPGRRRCSATRPAAP